MQLCQRHATTSYGIITTMKLRLPKQLKPVLAWAKKNKRLLIITAIAGAVMLFVVLPVITYVAFASQIQSKEAIITLKDGGITLLDRNEQPFFTLYDAKNREIVPLNKIAESAQNAVIAAEDQDFYTHPGFSISGIIRSATVNVATGGIRQGGSTITQQLVKNVLLTSEQTYIRKYQEIILAIEIDRRFSKEDILEMYLNTVYFGEGAFGIQRAAEIYFGKDASDLTIAESAMMAAVLPAPSAFSPVSGNKEEATRRQRNVLRLMLQEKYISQEEYEEALEETLDFTKGESGSVNVTAPHFALMVQEELAEKYGEQRLANSGFIVKTTLDTKLQQFAQTSVRNQVANLAGQNVTNGALVAMDPSSGEVVALVGSHNWADEENGKINMAVAARQPGSSFKPLVYATALEDKLITAGTVLKDEETDFGGGYKPKNYDNTFRGDVSIRRALAISLNIPAVEVMQKVGVNSMLNKSRALGITSLSRDRDYGLSLVLGSGEVPLIQMTNAYAAFAAEGELPERKIILEVRDKNKKTIFNNGDVSKKRVWDVATAYIISSILSDAQSRSEVFGSALNISRTAAVKTGTTDDNKDALTIGYTPQVVVGVWVGNSNNKPMSGVAGSLGAAPIWKSVMEQALSGRSAEWYKKPDSVEQVLICKEKGLRLPEDQKDATTSALMEYYIRGTEPKPDDMCIPQSPTPNPTEEAEKKKREDEERKKKEEENKKKNQPTATPRPSNTPVPTEVPEEDDDETPTPVPTTGSVIPSIGVTVGPTGGISPSPTP